MHHLSKVVESKPEGHRTRGASRPAGRGRTNFLALVFAAVTLTTGACGDDGSDDVGDTSPDAEPDADAEATGGSGHDMTGGEEGEEHDCAAEDWETGEARRPATRAASRRAAAAPPRSRTRPRSRCAPKPAGPRAWASAAASSASSPAPASTARAVARPRTATRSRYAIVPRDSATTRRSGASIISEALDGRGRAVLTHTATRRSFIHSDNTNQ
jgi:hypothetical protein